MSWRGIILTGTSAAGKTTLSARLREVDPSFEQVKAVTTRGPRADDEPGLYVHLSEEDFDRLGEGLVIWAGYRDRRYGITHEHIADVERRGTVPVLLITAQSLVEHLERAKGGSDRPFLSVFVDAPDEVLDARLAGRGGLIDRPKIERQRAEDRWYRNAARYVLENLNLEHSLRQLLKWWRQGSASRDATA